MALIHDNDTTVVSLCAPIGSLYDRIGIVEAPLGVGALTACLRGIGRIGLDRCPINMVSSPPNSLLIDCMVVNSAFDMMLADCGSWYLDRPWLTARHLWHYDIGC